MKVRLIKRTTIVRNALLFLFFSVLYLQITRSLIDGTSALNLNFFTIFIEEQVWLLGILVFVSVALYFALRFSNALFLLFCSLTLGNSIYYFWGNFDKLVLILIFTYGVCAVYFYLFLNLEKREAIYRPCFEKNYLGLLSEYNLPIVVESDFERIDGFLTNWDKSGCFVVLNDKYSSLQGKVVLKIEFENLSFECKGRVITSYGPGIGIQIENSKKLLSWGSFYSIINDRGFKPRFLR